MKTIGLFVFISFTLICCRRPGNGDPAATEKVMDVLQLSEIVHDTLTDKQLREIRRIHHVFSEVNSSSLEETINNFKRDQNPDNEIAIWLKMADAYERFALNKHIEEHDKKEEAFELLLLRSMMSERDVRNKTDFTYLSGDEIEELFSYYTDQPRPLIIDEKH